MAEKTIVPFYDYKKCFLQISVEARMQWPPHFHQYIEMVYVLRGEVYMDYWDTGKTRHSFVAKAGTMVFFPPYMIHAYQDRYAPQSEYMIMNYNAEDLSEDKFMNVTIENPCVSKDLLHEDVQYIINKFIRQEIVKEKPDIIRLYLKLILGRLRPVLKLETIEHDALQGSKEMEIISFVHDHYDENITLDEMAKKLGVNIYVMSRFFSEVLHMNFRTYLNSFRINKAEQLLKMTDESIINIQNLCGFESQQTFNRVFKKNTGVSPYQYRNINAQTEYIYPKDDKGAVLYFDDRIPGAQVVLNSKAYI